MADVDLDLLRCFVTVADARNFTTAGARLARSQSAVSVRIKKLEEVIGGQLLVRNNHNVSLTDRGKALLPKAKTLLEDGERLLAEMRSPVVSGKLRIGFLEYVAPHKIPDLLASIQRKLPDADVSFRVGLSQSLQAALRAGEIDLALALHDPQSETSTVMAIDPLVWVEGPEPANPNPKDGVGVCLMQPPCMYRQAALEVLSSADLGHQEVLTANSIQSVRSAVLYGLGFSVLGMSCLGEGLKVSLTLQNMGELPVATLSLHGSDHRKSEVVNVLRRIFQDELHNGPRITSSMRKTPDARSGGTL